MLFGAHVSVSGGLVSALDYAQSVGCECIQIFAKSPRQWHAKPMDRLAAETFKAARAEREFGPVFTHTAYLINLSTPEPVLWEKSVNALADELSRGSVLGAAGVVTHIGTNPDGDVERAASRVAEAIDRAFDAAGDDCATRLLLENTAGAGTTFGSSFEELAACIDASGLPVARLGVCIDTCHAWAHGAALDTAGGWEHYLDGASACCGTDRIGLIHANDCKFERGTHHDRHEWIGDGFIGIDGFSAMVCQSRLQNVPVVTEMPGEVPDKDRVNVGRLKDLRGACQASQ